MTQRTVSVLRTHDDRTIPVPGTYTIDGPHTSVEFVARHLMITKVRGRFVEVRGSIFIAEDPEQSNVEAEIRAASVSTGDAFRDAHLRGPDFLDVDRYPLITFRSTATTARAESIWELTGDLTVRDITRPVVLQVDFEGASPSPFGDERIAFSAAADVNREDFGLTWNQTLETGGVLIGKTIRIELNVQAIAAADAAVDLSRASDSPSASVHGAPTAF